MSDSIGVLGEQTISTIGTTTVYTVPVGYAARVRFEYLGQAAANSTLALVVRQMTIMTSAALTVNNYIFSTNSLMSVVSATLPDGTADNKTVAKGPYDYYLSAGDTVQYTIGTTNFQSIRVRVVGTLIQL
jgi:hypothetical protein